MTSEGSDSPPSNELVPAPEAEASGIATFRMTARWGLAWLSIHLLATAALKARLLPATATSGWLLIVVIGLGAMTVRSYLRFLLAASSATLRQQAVAVAVGFGVVGVASTSYRLVERLGGPRMDLNDPFWVGLLLWGVLSWRLQRRAD